MATRFEYLLNAMEHAALAPNPAEQQFGEKRQAVLDHVARLERGARRLRLLSAELTDLEHDAEAVGRGIRQLRTAIESEPIIEPETPTP